MHAFMRGELLTLNQLGVNAASTVAEGWLRGRLLNNGGNSTRFEVYRSISGTTISQSWK